MNDFLTEMEILEEVAWIGLHDAPAPLHVAVQQGSRSGAPVASHVTATIDMPGAKAPNFLSPADGLSGNNFAVLGGGFVMAW
jgi:hypothetical protein